MRENRTYGSEGGEGQTLPDPYHVDEVTSAWRLIRSSVVSFANQRPTARRG
jgi:hypothetical protein